MGKPDLLDTLVLEDQDEKKRHLMLQTQYHQRFSATHLPSLENLLKLLELEQMYSDAPQGRPITGGSIQPPPPTYIMNQGMRMKMMMTKSPTQADNLVHHAPHTFNKFPPVNFKAPPPHHPPAVPVIFHLASHDVNQPIHPPAYSPPSLPLPGSVTAIHIRVEEARW